MIIKFYETEKINIKKNNIILLYGKNEGLKNQKLEILVSNKKNIFKYEEKEILDNENYFFENTLNKSLFENEKVIIIKRATDKIYKILEEIVKKKINDILIIIDSDNLEKKSKLRSFFEKDKTLICVAFYPDNEQTLLKLTNDFFKKKNISVSQSNVNQIVNKSLGDRKYLLNELEKIENFARNGNRINTENISKIINLTENYSFSELVDNCLVKNKKKILSILNENNFTTEDCIIILRTFLNKAKKILILSKNFEKNKDINLTLSNAKPPIFWKDKEITKQQIYKWKPNSIKILIYKLNEIELDIKKNINNSINIVYDFILEQSSSETNN